MDRTGAWPRGQKALTNRFAISPSHPHFSGSDNRSKGADALHASIMAAGSGVSGRSFPTHVSESSSSRLGGRFDRKEGGEVCAALDLGTNNCRLMVASRTHAGFRVLDSYSRIVRLGEGLQLTGELNEAAMVRTLEALHVCNSRLGRHRPVRLRAVATEACRRARNGRDFVERIRQETGLEFEIISGREEAELAVESCAALLHGGAETSTAEAAPKWGLLLDVGGGSTEIAWVRLDKKARKHEVVSFVSLPVGVITLAELFPHRRPGVYKAMVTQVRQYLTDFEETHQIRQRVEEGGVRVVGTSGTVTTLASLDLDLPRYIRHAVDGYCLKPDNARNAIGRLHRMGMEGMRVHPCIGAERATYVMPGCAIFDAFLSLWPASVVVADRGLRDGLLLQMMAEDRSSLRDQSSQSTVG